MLAAAVSIDEVPDAIEARLVRWGRLVRGRYEALGFDESSAIARMMAEGAGAGMASDWGASHLADDSLEIDQAVARLPRRYKSAIRLNYMTDLPTDVKARILHTSRATFYLRLNAGKVGVYMTLMGRGYAGS